MFQRLIDELFSGLTFAYAYIDDVLITSKHLEELNTHLEQTFQRLTHASLFQGTAHE